MRLPLAVMLAVAGLAFPAAADGTGRFFYTRSPVAILRQNPPQVAAMPWQERASEPAALMLDAEIRDANILYNRQGWFSFDSPQDSSGLMLLFDTPQTAPIVRATQYAALDILMLDAKGKIVQILPGINLSELEEDIQPPGPILAFLFLKSGSCARLSLQLGDMVDYKIFKKPPTVLAPGVPPVPAPPVKASAPMMIQPAPPPVTPAATSILPAPASESRHTPSEQSGERFGTRLK